jgi:hypothetical protein
MVAIAIVPFAPAIRLFPQISGSTWSGWDQIAAAANDWRKRVDAEDAKPGNVFCFGADYKDAAQLTRALKILGNGTLPVPVLAQNVCGELALQFDHWDRPADHIGEHAIFVLARPDTRAQELAQARACFAKVEVVQRVTIQALGWKVLDADILVCRDYRGPKPATAPSSPK